MAIKLKTQPTHRFWSNSSGSSLIEVLVATMVVAVSLVAISIVLMYSVQRTAQARYEEIAKSLAQDGIETFHKERAFTGWSAFYNRFNGGGTFCVDTTTQTITTKSGSCPGIDQAGTTFNREVTATLTAGAIRVISQVTWVSGLGGGASTTRDVTLTQDFRKLF